SPPATPSEPQTKSAPSSAANTLPSDNEKNRWGLSKKMQKHMDDFLAKAAIFSQRLNSYTGTDYSGIEALRQEIIEQERDVKRQHAAIAVSKEQYQQAYAAQSASQKEVVGLLERKHSWAAGDLERYMSLIRSEHLNEQAVQRAKDELTSAERTLEEARSTLERKERKQYHEEQIWSDTIRRNSTWVTFGLMGLNIMLLLANLVLFEPWRRRRLVREVRVALEENALATNEKITAATSSARPAIEAVVDDTALAAGEVLPEEAVDVVSDTIPEAISEAIPETISDVLPEATKSKEPQHWQERVEERWQYWKTVVQDLFSDREVNVRRVDVTTVALESAAAGMAVMGFLILLFNPR
ncbi:Mdm33 family-domain-containing protein, partial [Delphinella strobiligena]